MSSKAQPSMSTSTLSLLSTQSISSSNLGLSSGDDMPGSSNRDRRSPDVRVVTPNSSNVILADTARIVGDLPLDDGEDMAPALAEGDSVKRLQLHDSTRSNESTATATTTNTTTATSSRSTSNPSSSSAATPKFRARPAPPTTNMEGLGPRLTKSAALRQGLKWEDPRDIRRMTGEGEVPVVFDNVPGHKRNLALNVASLAQPTVAPRQNRAALLRLGQVPEEDVKPDSAKIRAEMAARNKAREYQERLEKRKQIQMPASLTSPPEIAPRQNRAALLRQGQIPTESTPMKTAREMAEAAARNKARDAAERAERRKSIALPASLGTPSIAPRSNRASILRIGGGGGGGVGGETSKAGLSKLSSATTTAAGTRNRTGSAGAASSSSSATGATATNVTSSRAGSAAGDRPASILKPSTQPQTSGPPPPRPARSHARLRTETSTSTGTAATTSSSSSGTTDATASVTAGDKVSSSTSTSTNNASTSAPAPAPAPAPTPRRVTINPVRSVGASVGETPTSQAQHSFRSNRASILRVTPSGPTCNAATAAAPTPLPMLRSESHDSKVSSTSSVSIGGISAPTSTVSTDASVPSNKAVHSPSLNASRPRPVSTIIPSGPSSAAAYAQEMKERRMTQLMSGLEELARPIPPRIRTCGPDPPNDKYIAPRPAPAPPANVLSHRQSMFISAALGSPPNSSSGGTSPTSEDSLRLGLGLSNKTPSPPLGSGSSGNSASGSTSERKQLRMRHSASMLVNRLLPMNNGSKTSLLGGKVTKVSSRV